MKIASRKSKGDLIFDAINLVIMLAVSLVILYPLYFVIIASITDPSVVNKGGLLLYPEVLFVGGYKKIFEYQPLWLGYWNSIVYTAVGTLLNLLVTIPAAYAFSRTDLYGRRWMQKLFIFTMFFSGGLIPSYLVVDGLGLRDTIWAMILPVALSVYNLIIARSFFEGNMPIEMLEAAKIDGCGDMRYFVSIVLPLSKVIIAVMALFYAVSHWNSYFNALIYLNKEELYPLQIILRNLLIINTAGNSMIVDPMSLANKAKLAEQMKYGVIVVASLPLLMVYPFLQKYFTKGVMIGAVKG